jgi:hypothetical protein
VNVYEGGIPETTKGWFIGEVSKIVDTPSGEDIDNRDMPRQYFP